MPQKYGTRLAAGEVATVRDVVNITAKEEHGREMADTMGEGEEEGEEEGGMEVQGQGLMANGRVANTLNPIKVVGNLTKREDFRVMADTTGEGEEEEVGMEVKGQLLM